MEKTMKLNPEVRDTGLAWVGALFLNLAAAWLAPLVPVGRIVGGIPAPAPPPVRLAEVSPVRPPAPPEPAPVKPAAKQPVAARQGPAAAQNAPARRARPAPRVESARSVARGPKPVARKAVAVAAARAVVALEPPAPWETEATSRRPAAEPAAPSAAPTPAAQALEPAPWESLPARGGDGAKALRDAPASTGGGETAAPWEQGGGGTTPSWVRPIGDLRGRPVTWPTDCPRPIKPQEAPSLLLHRVTITIDEDGVALDINGPGEYSGVTKAVADCVVGRRIAGPKAGALAQGVKFELKLEDL